MSTIEQPSHLTLLSGATVTPRSSVAAQASRVADVHKEMRDLFEAAYLRSKLATGEHAKLVRAHL